jgi:hypothetical protein
MNALDRGDGEIGELLLIRGADVNHENKVCEMSCYNIMYILSIISIISIIFIKIIITYFIGWTNTINIG